LLFRSSLKEPALDRWLDVITIRGETESWRTWAQAVRLRRPAGKL
jgi:hypothetical protein